MRRQLAKDSQGSSDAIARWSMLLIHSIAAQAVSNESFFDKPTLIDEVLSEASSVAIESPDAPRNIWVKYKLQWSRYFVLQRTLTAFLAVPSREGLREWSLKTIRSCCQLKRRQRTTASTKITTNHEVGSHHAKNNYWTNCKMVSAFHWKPISKGYLLKPSKNSRKTRTRIATLCQLAWLR